VAEHTALAIRPSNPSPTWKKWLAITLLTAAGVTVGAGIAHAAMRSVPERDPDLEGFADAAISKHGTKASLNVLVDEAYFLAYPNCPTTLDPDNSAHAACISKWLVLREVVSERLPPVDYDAGPPASGEALPSTGPAAEMRGWLGSLTAKQRSDLRRIVGDEYVRPIEEAAEAGDDQGVIDAAIELKEAGEKLASESPLKAMSQYRELKSSLGPKLDELTRLASKYKSYAE